jgi:hypothetical protein
MSWSISFVGTPAGVARKFAESAANQRCQEPEESIKTLACQLVAKACEGMADGYAVSITADGSQWKDGETVRSQSVRLTFSTIGQLVTE